jgi:hypothetical protein
MLQSNDLSRSFTALNLDSTLIVVIEVSLSSWRRRNGPERRAAASEEIEARRRPTVETHRPIRDMTRHRVVREQIKEIEQERLRKLETAAIAEKDPHAMVRLICAGHRLVNKSTTCPTICETQRQSPDTLASPARRMKAGSDGVKRAWRAPEMRGCGAA